MLKKGHHHFLESGLDNVHLINVDVFACNDCGERIVSIPRSVELMQSIGESVLLKPTHLSGSEITFLRKNLLLKISEFAQLLGVDRVTVSRWENGRERPSRSTDRLIRLTYAVEAKAGESALETLRKNLRREPIDSQADYFVTLPLAS
jgi:putative zinc finger/helix-turn-helix YgiT family protein